MAAAVSSATAEGDHHDTPAMVATLPRISKADPLNGSLLLVNNHGMLFHPDLSDIQEDVAYARWLGSGLIRVFATDSNSALEWDGKLVGARIAEAAPLLRSAHTRLIVAFVNNHQAVPREPSDSVGWMDNYMQLLQPFYVTNWRGPYLEFMRDLVRTVWSHQAQDVIYAWELGNELHSPRQPDALRPFIVDAVGELRALDPVTPVLPGTMGANHIEPGNHRSPIARWLYCEAPVDAYTLHAYDWVSRQRPGDMPIDWDLDNIVSEPCPNGRALPVIVEELGTSRALEGVYSDTDERGRLDQELRQIEFVRSSPQVVGFGVWNGQSPRLFDRTFIDTRRGLTSYGSDSQGGGSCYDPSPDPAPSTRCQLEEVLRHMTSVRVDASRWKPAQRNDPDSSEQLIGSVDRVIRSNSDAMTSFSISGWVSDASGDDSTAVERVDLLLHSGDMDSELATAEIGLPRTDGPASETSGTRAPGFRLSLPIEKIPNGATTLELAARSRDGGAWLTTLYVVVPDLGTVPPPRPTPVPVPVPRTASPPEVPLSRVEAQAPQPGDLVTTTFSLQLLAPGADRADVFLEPGRDHGGRLAGSARVGSTAPGEPTLQVTVVVPAGRHTLDVHVYATLPSNGTSERVLTLPIVAR